MGDVDDLIEQRRALYSVAIELAAGPQPDPGPEVLDNPIVRAHLGAVLGGSVAYDADELSPLSDLGDSAASTDRVSVRLASAAHSERALSAALLRVAEELGRYGDVRPTLVTEGMANLAQVQARLADGVTLALRVAPKLVSDLLPHVALFAVFVQDGMERLGSASVREVPGLILLPQPDSIIEVAEALVHEGAHQKFFDLAMTRFLFAEHYHRAPLFIPPWAPAEAPAWPLEQVFAAFHAYCCLSAFAAEPQFPAGQLHEYSLFPMAPERSMVIGGWLLEQGAFLGVDGHLLVEALLGVAPADPPHIDMQAFVSGSLEDRGWAVTRRFVGRTLVASDGIPLELYWLRGEI
jgi:hypothetical protein